MCSAVFRSNLTAATMKPRSRSDVSCGSPLSFVERQHLMTDARRRSRLELLPTSLANPDVVRSSTPFAGVLARVDRQCDIGAGRKRLNLGGRRCRADDDAFAVPVEPDSRAREAERSSSCASGCSSHSLSYPVWINQASVAVCPWRSRPREPHGIRCRDGHRRRSDGCNLVEFTASQTPDTGPRWPSGSGRPRRATDANTWSG